MTDADVRTMIAVACLFGGGAGALAAAVVSVAAWLLLKRWRPRLLQAGPIDLDIRTKAVPVYLQVEVPALRPIRVPVFVAPEPAPSMKELGYRLLDVRPDFGTRPLAEFLGCSPGMAQAIVTDWRAARREPEATEAAGPA